MTSDVTRDMVVSAADGLRVGDPTSEQERSLDRLLRRMVEATVAIGTDSVDYTAFPTSSTSSVAGVLLDVTLTRTDTTATRTAAVVVLAPLDGATELAGSVVVSGLPVDDDTGGQTLYTANLSGPVHASTPIDASSVGVLQVAVTSVTITPPPAPDQPTPSTDAPTPRTAAELAAARKAYGVALAAAKAKYAKARKKAGSSKRRKAAAKKAYDQRRARAKAAYQAAIADVPASAASSRSSTAATTSTGQPTTIISTDVGWGALV